MWFWIKYSKNKTKQNSLYYFQNINVFFSLNYVFQDIVLICVSLLLWFLHNIPSQRIIVQLLSVVSFIFSLLTQKRQRKFHIHYTICLHSQYNIYVTPPLFLYIPTLCVCINYALIVSISHVICNMLYISFSIFPHISL